MAVYVTLLWLYWPLTNIGIANGTVVFSAVAPAVTTTRLGRPAASVPVVPVVDVNASEQL